MIKPASELIADAKAHCNCLDATSAKDLFDQSENCLIIDVREPGEVNESKLDCSINIPRGLLEMKITDFCTEPDQMILIHCAAGGRASLAAARLQEMGYTNVNVILAGYNEIKEVFT